MFIAQKFFPDAQRKENLEDGFTLIELLLYLSLSLIVFMVGGGILVSGLHAQSSTGAVTDAANTAQQIVRSVQAGVRNASAIAVTADLANGTQLLVARTIGTDPNSTIASCQAWYYTPLNGARSRSMSTVLRSRLVWLGAAFAGRARKHRQGE